MPANPENTAGKCKGQKPDVNGFFERHALPLEFTAHKIKGRSRQQKSGEQNTLR
jgi:hypothetical protein